MMQIGSQVQPTNEDGTSGSTHVAHDRSHHPFVGRLLQRATTVILFGCALVLNLYHLGQSSIWFDEAFSVELARQPLPLLWHIIFGPEPNMELYYLFLHIWLHITAASGFQATEFVVRFPSAIFGAMSTVVVFLLGRRFLGLLPGILASALYLLNYLQLVYAQQARSYAMQLLLICLAWYALFVALRGQKNTWRWWAVYTVAWTLATYAHMFSLLILFAQLVALAGILFLPNAWRDRLHACLKPLLLSLLVFSCLILPMLLVSLQGPKTEWLSVPGLHDLYYLLQQLSGNNKAYLLALLGLPGLVLCAFGLAYWKHSRPSLRPVGPVKTGRFRDRIFSPYSEYQQVVPVVWALGCWLVIPVVVSYIVSQGSIRLFSARYLVTIVPPLCLLVACLLPLLRQRVWQVLAMLGLLVLALPGVFQYYSSAQIEDWNTASHWLIQHYQDGDGLVCYDNAITQGCQISVEYYLHTYSDHIRFDADTPGAFSWTKYGPADPAAGSEAALDQATLTACAEKHTRLFFIVGRVRTDEAATHVKKVQQWLARRYHLLDQIETPTVTVHLYSID